jgi:hypothetical protein
MEIFSLRYYCQLFIGYPRLEGGYYFKLPIVEKGGNFLSVYLDVECPIRIPDFLEAGYGPVQFAKIQPSKYQLNKFHDLPPLPTRRAGNRRRQETVAQVVEIVLMGMLPVLFTDCANHTPPVFLVGYRFVNICPAFFD